MVYICIPIISLFVDFLHYIDLDIGADGRLSRPYAGSVSELAAFVKKAVKDGLKQELKSIDKKCKRNSDDSSMDLHAIDIELQEFNYDDMEKLVIKDPEDGEVDDASISTEMSVWKTGQDKIENSEKVKQDKLDFNLSPPFLDTIGKPEHREIFALDSVGLKHKEPLPVDDHTVEK